MMKKLMLGVALSALLASGAMAETSSPAPKSNPPTATKSAPPAAAKASPSTNGSASSSDAAKSNPSADKSAAAKPGMNAGKPNFVMSQKPDQFLASNFKGTDVMGSGNKKIGDVSDILFDKDGKIEAYVISIGGFLGMGAKEVALPPSAFQVEQGKKGESPKLRLSMTQKQLKEAQNFKPYSPPKPATTTGAGGAMGGGAPLGGGGMHPGRK